MNTRVSLSPRDHSLLRLLSWTPATTPQLLLASGTFAGGGYLDERRLRERLQTLREAGLVRAWQAAQPGGGLRNYYKLTPLGFAVSDSVATPPPRAFFAEVAPALLAHTFRLAEVIVATVRACHARGVTIERFLRENELTFQAGDRQVQPDGFFRVVTTDRRFNFALEIDNSTAPIDAPAVNSIHNKLTTYHAYQEQVLTGWRASGKTWERPRFRVVFLTRSVERAYHILAHAAAMTPAPKRRLVYAATLEAFVADAQPLHAPLFLDHHGHWQALVDPHPTAPFTRTPVRLARPVASPFVVC